jgi:hypothetical protein
MPSLLAPLCALVDRAINRRYAKLCLRDALLRGEHPYASHVLFDVPAEQGKLREREARACMRSGTAWGAHGEVRAYYIDRGLSAEMRAAMRDSDLLASSDAWPCQHVEFRTLWPRRNWTPHEIELRALLRRP